MKKILSILALAAGLSAPLEILPAEEVNARFGINLYQLRDWNRQQPYINLMKLSRPWISQRANQWDTNEELPLDENGYVKELQPGQWAATIMLTESTANFPGGEYILLYDGEGEFEWKQNARPIDSQPGREVVEVTPQDKGFIHLILKSVNPDNHPRNMRFFRKDLAEKVEKELFTPEFLKLWELAGTYRFMDWTQTNTSKQSEWKDRPLSSHRSYYTAGAPWEDIIELCNQTKTNAWINIPHLATDDYIRQTAQLFRDKLDPSLKTYFEFSNEVWNGMFPATRKSEQDGLADGLAAEGWRAGALQYGKNCVRMFGILDEVYKDVPRERYVKVVATQAANIGFAKIVVEAPGVAEGADVLAVAPYLTFNVPVQPSQWQPDMPVAAEVENWSLDQIFEYLNDKSLPQCLRWMDEQMQLAKEHNLGLVAYEAGQHLTALGEANRNQKLVSLLAEANRDPRMGEIYTQYLTHWTEIGGGLMCLFNDMQPFTNAGSWGLLEFWGQDAASSPKYAAVLKWAESLPQK